MTIRKAILPDSLLTHAFWEEDCKIVAEHDYDNAAADERVWMGEAHLHWSVITIDGNLVVDVDSGYHSEQEADAIVQAWRQRHCDD